MIVLTGASASGKTEVAKLLIAKHGVIKVVTHTTRSIRLGEADGVDYHFVSKEEFLRLKEQDYFIETTEYNGNYYGTSKKEVASNKALIVDPSGVQSFQDLHDPTIIIFRLLASETTRFNRMIIRGDSLEGIKRRIAEDKEWFAEDKYSDVHYTINTDYITIEEVADQIFKIYNSLMEKIN